MLLKFLHLIGLTNLSDKEVETYYDLKNKSYDEGPKQEKQFDLFPNYLLSTKPITTSKKVKQIAKFVVVGGTVVYVREQRQPDVDIYDSSPTSVGSGEAPTYKQVVYQ